MDDSIKTKPIADEITVNLGTQSYLLIELDEFSRKSQIRTNMSPELLDNVVFSLLAHLGKTQGGK